MRSKAPLALMEQAIMVLVFALAAALCLRVFVWSDGTSKSDQARDRAAVLVQTAAETVKHAGEAGGDADSVLAAAAEKLGGQVTDDADASLLQVLYDEDWNVAGERESAAYILCAQGADSSTAGLGEARVWVRELGSEDILFEVTVGWQTEVAE